MSQRQKGAPFSLHLGFCPLLTVCSTVFLLWIWGCTFGEGLGWLCLRCRIHLWLPQSNPPRPLWGLSCTSVPSRLDLSWPLASLVSLLKADGSGHRPPVSAAFLSPELKRNWGLDVSCKEDRPRTRCNVWRPPVLSLTHQWRPGPWKGHT